MARKIEKPAQTPEPEPADDLTGLDDLVDAINAAPDEGEALAADLTEPAVAGNNEPLPPPVAQVRVLHDYSGRRTNEQWIRAGVYAENDRALYGLARYLVANGHAEYVE